MTQPVDIEEGRRKAHVQPQTDNGWIKKIHKAQLIMLQKYLESVSCSLIMIMISNVTEYCGGGSQL